jgi:RHS repeat-associated protein
LATALWLAVGLPAAAAQVPSMKLAAADLVSPSAAWSFYGASTTHTLGLAVASDVGPEIAAMSRSLGATRYGAALYTQNVFDYVRNNIEIEFRFGLAKGARGALIDQSGTAFDQADLMVKLLRQGGVPNVSYRLGTITLTAAQFAQWTGLAANPGAAPAALTMEAAAACHLLADGGIPALVNGQSTCAAVSGSLSTVTLAHLWVAANGALYDPAFKPHTLKAGQDLPALMGCGSAAAPTCGSGVLGQMMSTASTPTVFGFTGVQNANESLAVGAVQAQAVSLQHAIEGSNPGAGLDDIIGGKRIDATYAPNPGASLPYASAEQRVWDGAAGIPDQFRSTLTLHTDTYDGLFYSDEISTRRLQLANGAVFVDDVKISACPGNPCLTLAPAVLSVTAAHPYAYQGGAWATNTMGSGVSGIFVTIIQSWGDASPPTQKFFTDLVASDTATSPACSPAAGACAQVNQVDDQVALVASFFVQRSLFNRLLGQVSHAAVTAHHTIGAIGNAGDPASSYTTSAVSTISVTPATYSSAAVTSVFEASSVAQAAIEGVDMQQARHAPVALSSVTAFVQENRLHTPFVQMPGASVAAFAQSVGAQGFWGAATPQLFSDGAAYDWILATDPSAVYTYVPAYADPAVNPNHLFFTTFFNLALKPGMNAYLLGGNAKGATTPAPVGSDPVADVMKAAHAVEAGRAIKAVSVDEATGTLNVNPEPDLVTGAGEFPFSLPFQRFYNSGSGMEVTGPTTWRYSGPDEDAFSHLGAGWSHNFEVTASISSNPQKSFGRDGALNASAAIAAAVVLNDLLKTPDLQHRMAGMFAAYWLGGQIDDNAVVVSKPPAQEAFLLLPDGRFNAPPASASTLVQHGARASFITASVYGGGPVTMASDYSPITYTYVDRDGAQIDFDVASLKPNMELSVIVGWSGDPVFKAARWTFPNGVKITFNYQFEQLNWTGLSLIGPTYQRYNLIGVSNSLGRSLAFTTAATGPSYQYQVNGGGPFGPFQKSFNVGLKITGVTDDSSRTVQYTLANCPTGPPIAGNLDFSTKAFACNSFLVTGPIAGQPRAKYEYAADGASPDPSVVVRPTYKLRRIYSATDQSSPLLIVAYDDVLRVATETDALQRRTMHLPGGLSEELWKRAEKVDARGNGWISYFDENGSLTKAVDPTGKATDHVYDPMRRLVRSVNPEGDATEQTYDVRSNALVTTRRPKPAASPVLPSQVTTTDYPAAEAGLLTCQNPKTCNKPVRITDARGGVTQFLWDVGSGQLAQILGPADVHGVQPQSDFTYAGQTMGVDIVQLLTSVIKKIAPGQSVTTAYAYNAGNKYVLDHATVDPSGLALTTGFSFDLAGNVTQVNGPRDDVVDLTNYVWDADRRLTYEVLPDPDGVGPAVRTTSHWIYDDDGLFLYLEQGSSTSAQAAGFTPLLRTEYQHDAVGNRVLEAVREVSSGARIRLTQMAYDATDHLACTAVRMDSATFGTYPADACVLADPNAATPDRVTKNGYNERGELTDVYRGFGAGGGVHEAFGYSANGQKVGVTDANGNLTTLRYDGFDRLASLLYPVLGRGQGVSNTQDHEDFTYDANGNRLTFRRRNGASLTYAYDALNRMTEKHLQADAAHDVYYDYDLAGRMTAARFGGPAGDGTVLTYDLAGRLRSDQTFGRTVGSDFDKAGHRIAMTLSDGFAVAYDYDAAGRVAGIREPAQGACPTTTTLLCLTYDALGRRTRLDRGNGGYATYGYDSAGLLAGLTQAGAAAAPASLQAISYNAASQVKQLDQQSDSYVWTGRPPTAPSRTYDGLNRDATYTAIQGYNDNGDLTKDGVRVFTYDLENRLTRMAPASGPGVTLDLGYDPLGRLARTTATVGGSATDTNFLYDGDRLVGEYGSGGTALRHYVHGAGVDEPLVWYEGAAQSAPKYWLHADRQGSIIAASDGNGLINDRTYTYGPYGEPSDWGPLRFRYTGQIALQEAQLYHYKARVYDPLMGRFLQTDPIGMKDDLELYGYVKDDPTNHGDPAGTETGSFSNGSQPALGGSLSETLDQASTILDGLAGALMGMGPMGPAAGETAEAGARGLERAAVAGRAIEGAGTELVQRVMSRAELKATQESGLLRGGRAGTHYVTDSANSSATRARQRLALPQTPEVKVTVEVEKGKFTEPSKVAPDNKMPGGGRERTAEGPVAVIIRKIEEMRK